MKQLTPDFSTFINGIALLLFGVALLPLIVLSFYNHASAVDDYCFADTSLKYGIWRAQKYYYDGWTGRYFSNMIVHTSPLVWGWYGGFRLIPALLVTGLVAALFTLFGELMPTLSSGVRLTLTGLFFFLYTLAHPSINEAYFWMSAAASYTVPLILTLYLFTVMIRWYRIRRQPMKGLTTIWACFLVFAVVGSSETNLVLILLVLAGLLVYRLLFLRAVDGFIILLLVIGLISTWLLFRAPGNAIRMNGNPNGGNFMFSFIAAFKYLAQSVFTWITQTPVLIMGVLWLPIARRLARSDNPARLYVALPPWLVIVSYMGLLAALIFPSYYGVGIGPAPRVINIVYLFFLLGWFYTLAVCVVYADRKGWLTNRLPVTNSIIVIGLAGLWVSFSGFSSEPLRQLYSDWLSGQAAAYDQEMMTRYRILTDKSIDTARLEPIKARSVILFSSDINPDVNHLWNRCEAGYYGKKVVILKQPLETSSSAGK